MIRKMNLLFAAVLALLAGSDMSAETALSLDGAWKFRQVNTEKWMEGTVPGCVHTDLMAAGVIPDPFYGENEKSMQWLGEKDWEYVREFDVTEEMMEHTFVELVMEGIDTYADVYVNGNLLLCCDNMFRTWKVDVKPYIKPGRNVIRLKFSSIFKIDMPKYLSADFKLMAWPNNDQGDIWLSLYARKAGYNYGWDWGPRLITTGIWRSIRLRAWSEADFQEAFVKTLKLPEGKRKYADMEAVCDIEAEKGMTGTLSLNVDGQKFEKEVTLEKGQNRIPLGFRMKNPELWWCNGAGNQKLYDFEFIFNAADVSIHKTVKTGVRTVEVVREDDEWGKSMYVVLNGRPIFMKGANYIPADNFPARVSREDYEHVVRTAVESNMNMLRIWGGGIYENDAFYELCDRYGILIWHDMMFACGMFPADERYLESVAHEVEDNVTRLRNHPSIALWCGNNENEISYFGWGWQGRLTPEHDMIYQADLKKLFYETIPESLEKVDGTRYYHPTSPVTGYNGIASNYGDVHFWSVWKGGWIEEYEKPWNIGRFMSEYGFQSYPSLEAIEAVIPENQRFIGSNAMLAHQRAKDDETRDPHYGDNMMKMYMAKYFHVPDDFDDFIFMSQLMQAEAVRKAVEAHRRAKPYCMGTLYWQINDCWPVASWASMDYYGNWKPLQYYAKRLFEDVLVSAYEKDGMVSFKVVSDKTDALKGVLEIKALTLGGKVVSEKRIPVAVGADGCVDVLSLSKDELYAGCPENEVVVSMRLASGDELVAENVWYPVYPNAYSYPEPEFTVTCSTVEGGVEMVLRSDVLIRDLWFSAEGAEFGDNAVTLVPGEVKRIYVKTDMPLEKFEECLSWVSLNDVVPE